MAKGRDLEETELDTENAKHLRQTLKLNLSQYSNRLELIRERIEGGVRLHHLLGSDIKEKDVQQEMQRLAEKICASNLFERYKDVSKGPRLNIGKFDKISTPTKDSADNCSFWHNNAVRYDMNREANNLIKTTETNVDDDEEHSKMADSGVGGCFRCEIDDKLMRTCSCQSFDEPTSKSHNIDDMEDECFDNNIIAPLKPNAHLYSYASNIALPDMENTSGLTPKTQKYVSFLLLNIILYNKNLLFRLYV